MIFNDAGRMVNAEWESIPERFPGIELGAFVVMPNHFHAIVIIHGGATTTGGAGLVPAPEGDHKGHHEGRPDRSKDRADIGTDYWSV